MSITSAALQVLLELRGYGWLSLIVGILPSFAIDPSGYCADGPPALPTITPTDARALLNLAPADELAVATDKVKDIALHYVWWDICQCSGAVAVYPSAPQTPVEVTGGPGDAGASCGFTFTNSQAYIKPDPPSNLSYSMGQMTWTLGFAADTAGEAADDCKKLRWTFHRTRGSGTHDDPLTFAYRYVAHAGSGAADITGTLVFSGDDHVELFTPPGYPYYSFIGAFEITTENAADTIAATLECLCDAAPTRQSATCCPPDPAILAAIAKLQSDLTNTKTQVDLIQRQGVPFGYIAQDSHNFLSGNGHIDVSGLLGALIVIQDLPSDVTIYDGDTQEVYTESWINWSLDFFTTPREFIRGYTQFSFPKNAGIYNKISYSIRPGVLLGITPLVREP